MDPVNNGPGQSNCKGVSESCEYSSDLKAKNACIDNKPTANTCSNMAANNKVSIWGSKQPECGLIDLSNKDQSLQQNPALNYRQIANNIAEKLAGTLFGSDKARIAPTTSILSSAILSSFGFNPSGKNLFNDTDSTDDTKTTAEENSGFDDISESNSGTTESKTIPKVYGNNPKVNQLGRFLENDDQINYQLGETKNPSPEQEAQVRDLNETIDTLPGNKNNVWTKVDESNFMDFKEGQTWTPSGFMNGYTSQQNALTDAKKEYPDEAAYMFKINGGGAQVPESITKNNNEDVIYNSDTKFRVGKKNEDQGYIELFPEENPNIDQLGRFLENDDQINYQLETNKPSPEQKEQVKDLNEIIDTLPGNKNNVWTKVDESQFMDFKEGQTWTPSGFINGYTSQKNALTDAKKEYPDEAAYMFRINGGGAQVPESITKNNNENVIYNSDTKFKVGKKHEDEGYIDLLPT